MRTDLSDIAKHLVEMLGGGLYLTWAEICGALPDADQSAISRELDQLTRARVILKGITTAEPFDSAYWLEHRPRPAGVRDCAVLTMADAGGIGNRQYFAGFNTQKTVEPVLTATRIDVSDAAGNLRSFPVVASAPALLARAAEHMADRAATYDKPEGERSMGTTVVAFNAITGRDVTEAEGWLLLQLLKDVRLFQRSGYHADSAEDCIAYSALKAEAKSREQGAANE